MTNERRRMTTRQEHENEDEEQDGEIQRFIQTQQTTNTSSNSSIVITSICMIIYRHLRTCLIFLTRSHGWLNPLVYVLCILLLLSYLLPNCPCTDDRQLQHECRVQRRSEEFIHHARYELMRDEYREKAKRLANTQNYDEFVKVYRHTICGGGNTLSSPSTSMMMDTNSESASVAPPIMISIKSSPYLSSIPIHHYTRTMSSMYYAQIERLTSTHGLFDRFESPRAYQMMIMKQQQQDITLAYDANIDTIDDGDRVWIDEERRVQNVIKKMIGGSQQQQTNMNDQVWNTRLSSDSVSRWMDLPTPILWVGGFRTPKWNPAAQARFIQLLRSQQFPQPPVDCRKQKFIVFDQWTRGFFSRYDVAARSFLFGMNVPDRMMLLGFETMYFPKSLIQSHARDDFLGEGINKYFLPYSQCQSDPYVIQMLRRGTQGLIDAGVPMISNDLTDIIGPTSKHWNTQWIRMDRQFEDEPSFDSWMRKAMFDYGPSRTTIDTIFQSTMNTDMNHTQLDMARQYDRDVGLEDDSTTSTTTSSSLSSTRLGSASGAIWSKIAANHFASPSSSSDRVSMQMSDHAHEHIYPTNYTSIYPQYPTSITPTQRDESAESTGRLWYDFANLNMIAYLYQPRPRIQFLANLITEHYMNQMLGRDGIIPDGDLISPHSPSRVNVRKLFGHGELGAIMIRRGDKCPEDPYCRTHGQFRPAGLFLHGIRLEEKKRNRRFKAIFITSDDNSEVEKLLSYSTAHHNPDEMMSSEAQIEQAYATRDDDIISRAILKGRWLLHNPFSPPGCFDPSTFIGFDSFLASMDFLLNHQAFIVGHESSNVSWFLARYLYTRRVIRDMETRAGDGAQHQDVMDEYDE